MPAMHESEPGAKSRQAQRACALAVTILLALSSGCASAPERRPLQQLVEEAIVASQNVAQASSPNKFREPVLLDPIQPVGSSGHTIGPPIVEPVSGEFSTESRPVGPGHTIPLPPLPFHEKAPPREPLYPPTSPIAPPPLRPPAGPPVSEIFVETDVREALQILASQARVSIIVDEQVHGVTSASLDNEPFEAALEKVLLPLGYVFRREGNQYLIGVPDPASSLFPRISERHDYYTRHLAPSELLDLLPEHLSRFVRTSEKRNLIIVEAPARISEQILEDLIRSDQPVGQVVLEAFVCVVSPDSGLQFGLDFQQGIPFGGNSAVNLALAGLNLAGDYGTQGLSNFAFTSALLKAMEREGYVSIRAAPRVMAKDGETARISIARETFFSVQPPDVQLLFRQDIQKIEAGIGLDITPVIRGDHITVKIERAEVSEGLDQAAVMQQQNNGFPIINRRLVSTTVHVQDGETITIGGLVQQQQVDRLNKIPILGHLPLIGKLFQRIDRREEDAEVIIFISPRIVREEL